MNDILTTQFDESLKENVAHFQRYPEMLPFVGSAWENSPKVLLIAESHYLPYDEIKSYSSFDYNECWYEGSSEGLDSNHKNYITTRNNLRNVESGLYLKPLAMYFNVKSAINGIEEWSSKNSTFSHFSFYNYFQKPAYILEQKYEDRSIKPTIVDRQVAFETLAKIVRILHPKTIIFISKKAYDSFIDLKGNSGIDFNDIKIDFVPHAGRFWWNKRSKKYGDRTGKAKFIHLLKQSLNDHMTAT